MRCRWCVGFAYEVDAKNGTDNTVIPTALATGNCELRAECVVKEVLTDDRGGAIGVAYLDAQDKLRVQPADLVVVSCAAPETARLLLNSRSKLFPRGLGNRYDWVGRNLQGHGYAGAYVLFDYDVYDDLGHEKHGRKMRASCANCHPQLSNCGLDVETMDTTFRSTKSPHNIHFVKCADCHRKGVPRKRVIKG
jgi:choline dehydrogenase-like flavoprotein